MSTKAYNTHIKKSVRFFISKHQPMNRLYNQRCYLAGAIDRVHDRGIGWRSKISPFLESLNVSILNPLIKPSECGLENIENHNIKLNLKKNKKYDELSNLMKTIRSVDLRLVDISDFIIANLDLETHPCGTLEEIFWANRQKKPIILHMVQGKENTPDWLFGTIPHEMIFSEWQDIFSYLDYINSSKKIDSYNRWYFFNI